MHLRSKGYLLQRIKDVPVARYALRKKTGSIQWVTGLFFLLFLLFFLCAQLQIDVYQASAMYLEDALAASNLASAVIDIEEYGISHTIRIADAREAYERYRTAVKENLALDDNWQCGNSTLIAGTVVIEEYIIYNVEKEKVNIYRISRDGSLSTAQGTPGFVTAPNGIAVEATGIYSEISFPVKGMFGITVQAHKGKLADVVSETTGEQGKDEV